MVYYTYVDNTYVIPGFYAKIEYSSYA
jgi:hypothetical protein